jgi:formylglycine-generating enzyme required for sulfatase activity
MGRLRVRTIAAGAAFLASSLGFVASCFPDYSFAPSGADAGGGTDGQVAADVTADSGTHDAGGRDVTMGDDTGADVVSTRDGIGPVPDAAEEGPVDAGDGAALGDAAWTSATVTFTGSSFDFAVAGNTVHATLDYTFVIDAYEVSVARFRTWVEAGMPLPCNDGGACALEKAGPYANAMFWDPAWNGQAQSMDFQGGLSGCQNTGAPGTATFMLPNADTYAVTCVNWAQAAAFCAFERKRLPTAAEWFFVATSGGGRRNEYPWGSAAPTCSLATLALNGGNCGYPVPLGTTSAQILGVHDLIGGVSEWVWDAVFMKDLTTYPPDATDYPGPPYQGPVAGRGSFWVQSAFDTPDQNLAYSTLEVSGNQPDLGWQDLGFRCAQGP